MSEDGEPIEIHIHHGGQGRFHLAGSGEYAGREGVFLNDGDVLFLKVDSSGRVWMQGNADYDSDENRGVLAQALHATAEHVANGGALRSDAPGRKP